MPNESVRAVDQSEDTEVVTALTAVCREADRTFERVGGGSRHWVRDCFLPLLNRAGWALLRAEAATVAGEDFWMDELEFQLGRPLTPHGRDCLRSWLRAFAANVKRRATEANHG